MACYALLLGLQSGIGRMAYRCSNRVLVQCWCKKFEVDSLLAHTTPGLEHDADARHAAEKGNSRRQTPKRKSLAVLGTDGAVICSSGQTSLDQCNIDACSEAGRAAALKRLAERKCINQHTCTCKGSQRP